jgi:HPr kinase/phosphorylase
LPHLPRLTAAAVGGTCMEKVRRTPASLKKMVEIFSMEILHKGRDFDNTVVTISDVNRPALQLVGFYDYFDDKRLQILGRGEMRFLDRMTETERMRVFNKLLSYPFPALIVAREMDVPTELVQMAEKHDRTLLRSAESTVDVTSKLIDYLNRAMAPQIARHGVLMNIYGQGVLILGDSGIGKSETAIELLKRGHRLVADDAVEIRRISNSLFGTAPEIIRHYIEIRGVGVIDVQQLFGMGAVQFDTEIDLVIQLEQWIDGKFYDRLGLGEEKYEILGVELPIVTIPVRPGRNLAGIVEIATMKNRQMKYGYNAARDFVTQFDSKVDEMMKEKQTE